MVKRKYTYLSCSRCGKRFRGTTRSEAFAKLKKHLWKFHRDWMVSRIKRGLKKSNRSKNGALPNFPSWIGFAEKPLIEKVTGRPYEQVKSAVLDFMVSALLGGITKP